MRKRVLSFLLVSSFIATILSGCASSSKKELEIGIMSNLDAIPFIIAEQQGYLENVKLSKFKSAKDRDTAFNAGTLDGIAADVLAASFAKESGAKVSITSMTQGSFILVAGKNTGITDISQVDGKSAAISQNTIIEYTLDKMLEQSSNITVKKEVIQDIPTRLEMLEQGKVDIALFPEPFAASAIANGAVKLKNADEMGLISGIMIFKDDSIKSQKSQIVKLYEAYNKAVDYLEQNDRSTYIEYVGKELGFPENVNDTVVLPTFTHAVLPSEEVITATEKWLVDRTLIKTAYTYDQLISTAFVKK